MFFAVNAYAQHPGGWGVGGVVQYNLPWDGFDGHIAAAISLKVPQLPIYWGLNFTFPRNAFSTRATADYYLMDFSNSTGDTGFFAGFGGYFGFYSEKSRTSIAFGPRFPIGFYTIRFGIFEIFLSLTPSLGVDIRFGDFPGKSFTFPNFFLGADLGVRMWIGS